MAGNLTLLPARKLTVAAKTTVADNLTLNPTRKLAVAAKTTVAGNIEEGFAKAVAGNKAMAGSKAVAETVGGDLA